MKILVACEESQAVTIELRKLGHEAYSCDIVEESGGHHEWHIRHDVLPLITGDPCEFTTGDGVVHQLNTKWDMIIAFPPCTHLAVSGARHFESKRKDGRQKNAIEFFMKIINANCDKVSVENPVGIISGDYIQKWFPEISAKYGLPIKPTQVIQPYQFGSPVKKTTCLWLKGLPNIKPTEDVMDKVKYYTSPSGKRMSEWNARQLVIDGKKYGYNTDEYKRHRSKTFPGIAKAMATQWAGKIN